MWCVKSSKKQIVEHLVCIEQPVSETRGQGELLGGLHESEFEWARLKLGPAKSADIDGEIQPFRVEPSGFWDVLVQLQYPPKRRRCHFSVFAVGDLERESAESRTRLLINHLRPKAQGPSLYRELCAAFQYICQNDLFSLNC